MEDDGNCSDGYYPMEDEYDMDNGLVEGFCDSDDFDFDLDESPEPKTEKSRNQDPTKVKYRCLALQETENPFLQKGNKIIMPADSLPLLLSKMEVEWRSDTSLPMLFRAENRCTGKATYCGVLEFTGSDPKQVFFPNWMMVNLGLDEGEIVTLQSTNLKKATFIKLQPHTAAFLSIRNPKAVLEENLVNFACVAAGDTISVTHKGEVFAVDVVEARPRSAVCLIDTDCEVDFLPPLDYKEPEPEKRSEPAAVAMAAGKTEFGAFTGFGRRLDGQVCSSGLESSGAPAAAPAAATRSGCKCNNGGRVEEGAKEKPKFLAFTGKKYTLGGS